MAKLIITIEFDTNEDRMRYTIDGVKGLRFGDVQDATLNALGNVMDRICTLTPDELQYWQISTRLQ